MVKGSKITATCVGVTPYNVISGICAAIRTAHSLKMGYDNDFSTFEARPELSSNRKPYLG
jgi:hypothetical protein